MIYFISSNATEYTITFAIAGARYEYYLDPKPFYGIEWQAKRWPKRALARAKAKAYKWERL